MSADPVWINHPAPGGIDPSDRGLLLGDGVFDTLVAFGGIPFLGDRHLERLVSQAGEIGIALDSAEVRDGWRAVLGGAGPDGAILRTTVTRGRTPRGLWPAAAPAPTVIVAASPWSTGPMCRPARLVTSTIARNKGSPTSRLKTLNYLDNILAAREASERGVDDALILNGAGRVACTTIANLFAVSGDEIATPPVADGVQPGIMRALVIEIAPAAGLDPVERSLTPAELRSADGVFLTNSVRFLCPVVALDGASLGRRAGPAMREITARISERLRAGCRVDLPWPSLCEQEPVA